MNKVSIIIINYNTFDYTKNCINSIFEHLGKFDFEIILIDNNSPDGSGVKLKKYFGDKLKYILNSDNLGFSIANNQGAKLARGKYLLFLNSDTLVDEIDLNKIDNFFIEHQDIGIASLDLLLENHKRQEYAFGKFLSFFNLLNRKSNQGNDRGEYIEADWVSGAAIIINRNLFKEIGGFDDRYFMYFEDMDLCRILQKWGKKACLLKKYSVIHFGGKSSSDYNKIKKDYYLSQDKYFCKFYGTFISRFVKFIRFLYLKLTKK